MIFSAGFPWVLSRVADVTRVVVGSVCWCFGGWPFFAPVFPLWI